MTRSSQNSFHSVPFLPSDKKKLVRWGIVLAGGEGKRMSPLVKNWLGENRPKQYCTFVGSRSMFQHTLDRMRSLVSGDHIVTVIRQGHRRFLDESMMGELPGQLIEQPLDLGTAPGVFLPMAYVLAKDPDATLVFFPCDHFVHPEERFYHHVNHACELAEACREQIILLAAVPNRVETDYGWIRPGALAGQGTSRADARGLLKVQTFREKPEANEAQALFQEGCLWNTMVMAVRARTLWAMGRQYLPEMMYGFDAFLRVLQAVREEQLDPEFEEVALARLYEQLEPADFSKDILQHATERSLVLPMDGVDWCDWGRPQRVTQTLARLDLRPLFPSQSVEPVFKTAFAGNYAGRASRNSRA